MVEELGRCKGDLLPRKTFAFKSRAKTSATPPPTSTTPSPSPSPPLPSSSPAEAAAILARFAIKDAKYKLSDRYILCLFQRLQDMYLTLLHLPTPIDQMVPSVLWLVLWQVVMCSYHDYVI
jgi:hypothetical protein